MLVGEEWGRGGSRPLYRPLDLLRTFAIKGDAQAAQRLTLPESSKNPEVAVGRSHQSLKGRKFKVIRSGQQLHIYIYISSRLLK